MRPNLTSTPSRPTKDKQKRYLSPSQKTTPGKHKRKKLIPDEEKNLDESELAEPIGNKNNKLKV